MIKKTLPDFLIKHASLKNVLLLFGLFLLFSAGILPSMEADIKAMSGGVGVLDLRFYYYPQTAHEMLAAYGPEGSRLYLIAQWTADLIFPVIGGFFVTMLLLWSGARRWYWLGALVTLNDWIENIFITVLLVQYPHFNENIAWGSTVFTSLKWSCFFISWLIAIYHLGRKFRSGTFKTEIAS